MSLVAAGQAPSGFDVEAIDWIAEEIDVEVSHKPIEWDGIITSLLIKKLILSLQEHIKKLIDPDMILNPGKIFSAH